MEEIIENEINEELEKEILKLKGELNVTEFKIEKNPPITKPTKELTQEEIDELLKPRKIETIK